MARFLVMEIEECMTSDHCCVDLLAEAGRAMLYPA
jgi:hypothetical protein